MIAAPNTCRRLPSARATVPDRRGYATPYLLKEFSASAAGSRFTLLLLEVADTERSPRRAFALPDGRLAYLVTAAGLPVRRFAKGLYELADLPGLLLTANDPEAP